MPIQEHGREGATQEVEQFEPSDSSEGNERRAAVKTVVVKAGPSPSKRQHRGSTRDGGGGVKSGGREGGPSRRRMRVRVHFDRFAPQWDEW